MATIRGGIVNDYSWTQAPLIVGAPMRLIANAGLAAAISNAGGLGYIGAGNDVSSLEAELEKYKTLATVQQEAVGTPVGIGLICWAGDELLQKVTPILAKYKPAAVWLFAPRDKNDLPRWTKTIRDATSSTKIWIQIGTVADAKEIASSCSPDVLVVQGTDAGGHGLQQGASIITLLPEVQDALAQLVSSGQLEKCPYLIAAGGLMEGRGVAGALALGADGACLGTRYLASPEASILKGYQDAVLSASDGGVTTARGKLYDSLRGTTDWPDQYGGRGVLNESWHDSIKGLSFEENKKLYDEALKKGDNGWGANARLTTYAGTGVGLVSTVKSAGAITEEVRQAALDVLRQRASKWL